jgi:hypothetical protein
LTLKHFNPRPNGVRAAATDAQTKNTTEDGSYPSRARDCHDLPLFLGPRRTGLLKIDPGMGTGWNTKLDRTSRIKTPFIPPMQSRFCLATLAQIFCSAMAAAAEWAAMNE